jgi:hypothetical protein
MRVQQVRPKELAIEKLPDGSTAIFDSRTKTVYSLNPFAAAAWEASADFSALPGIVEEMRRSFNPGVTEEAASEALFQLQERGLVEISTPLQSLSRRSVFAAAGGALAPVVLALTATEQRAFAFAIGSGTTTTTTPAPTTTTTTPAPTTTTTTTTTTTSTTTTRTPV